MIAILHYTFIYTGSITLWVNDPARAISEESDKGNRAELLKGVQLLIIVGLRTGSMAWFIVI
jgi:hypothetical protein